MLKIVLYSVAKYKIFKCVKPTSTLYSVIEIISSLAEHVNYFKGSVWFF